MLIKRPLNKGRNERGKGVGGWGVGFSIIIRVIPTKSDDVKPLN